MKSKLYGTTSLSLQCGISLVSTLFLLCRLSAFLQLWIGYRTQEDYFFISLLSGISLGIFVKVKSHSTIDCVPTMYKINCKQCNENSALINERILKNLLYTRLKGSIWCVGKVMLEVISFTISTSLHKTE